MLEYALQRFAEQLQQRLKQIEEENRRAADGVASLQIKRLELKAKATNLAEAIAAIGHSPTLIAQLANVELEIERINQRLAQVNNPKNLAVTMAEIREFVSRKILDLHSLLHSDINIARQVLASHVEKLVLTPKQTPEGPVFEVSGDVDLLGGDQGVMLLVARDGFGQHYTGLRLPLTGCG